MTEQADPGFTKELKSLGAKIKQARTEKGLSVRDMVIQHNYHEAQWRRYERGGSLTLPSLIRIARALGTSLSILLDGIGEYAPTFKVGKSEASSSGAKQKTATRKIKSV